MQGLSGDDSSVFESLPNVIDRFKGLLPFAWRNNPVQMEGPFVSFAVLSVAWKSEAKCVSLLD